MKKQRIGCLILIFVLLCLIGAFVYKLPPVYDRVGWRVEALQARIHYALFPPEEVVFQPATEPGVPLPQIDLPTATPSIVPSSTPTLPGPTATPTIPPTPTATPTPIPFQAKLTGIRHMYQRYNNCGPANLAMALSYWGWEGDQYETAAYLKPNSRDKNVMPYEMETFVEEKTDLNALVRAGGDLEMLKRFIAAGFPVIVEKGFEGPRFEGWMGHYEVVSGYDDAEQNFFVQDSYEGPDWPVTYDQMLEGWRGFNYTYIVIYSDERQDEVMAILGPQADLNVNYQAALEKAISETASLSGRDLYFTWFNRGTNLVAKHDYQAAATAFDAAFANYPDIPTKQRPWRMLWYQTGPYFAYYYTGRYQDVIDLATTTLNAMNEPILEESYYWRGMARLALGDNVGAIADFRKAEQVHPDFLPAVEQLNSLGESG